MRLIRFVKEFFVLFPLLLTFTSSIPDKVCKGDVILDSSNIDSFKNCTKINGSLVIENVTFTGEKAIPKMDPSELEVFITVKEITGSLNVTASHPDFTDLRYFRNLQIIGETWHQSAVRIAGTSLKSLGLRSLKRIRGKIYIGKNKNLCFAEGIDWRKLRRWDYDISVKSGWYESPSYTNIRVEKNRPKDACRVDNMFCHEECPKDGCWGPGVDECLSWKTFSPDGTRLDTSSYPVIYQSDDHTYAKCHEECDSNCTGPGPGNCMKCMRVKYRRDCVASCPTMTYEMNFVCVQCNEKCVAGCTGSGDFLGSGGCDKVMARNNNPQVSSRKNARGRFLKIDEPCKEGNFSEVVNVTGTTKPWKSICRPCHPSCKKCTGYGSHLSVCNECAKFRSEEQCEDQCPNEYYTDNTSMRCIRCSSNCKGCRGNGSNQCESCRLFKVPLGESITHQFICSDKCPEDKPHTWYDEGGPYCSAKDPLERINIPAIVGGILGITFLIGIFVAYFGYQWWQRAKSRENTVKMTMGMNGLEECEPLKPSDMKPNLAQLRIVKESELRKGGILGYGAFGTVYKAAWVPEGDNVRIPVAIKVLREGTGTNTIMDILEEAYIMASMVHPHLLKLLAVCMTSQMMLVTQLMPLGCLLDYVPNNKDKIGSKPLLNWCTQIAKGMAYLEDKRLVHRDLAARNILVHTPDCVKITDFGLSKLLDVDEEAYNATGGKLAIKWLALECIHHCRFTHKSDVWAFGVTVWELLTYGGRPYEQIPAREVANRLENGERLTQPSICTIEVYIIIVKCWVLNPESRPAFKELAGEFAKMARDPGRYLVIQGDILMKLPIYTSQDEMELIRRLSVTTEGTEDFMDAEEYLRPRSPVGDVTRDRISHDYLGVVDNGSRDDRAELHVNSLYGIDAVCATVDNVPDSLIVTLKDPIDREGYLIPVSPLHQYDSIVYRDLTGDSQQGADNPVHDIP